MDGYDCILDNELNQGFTQERRIFMNINIGDSIFIPNIAGGEKIWEFPITAINIVNGEPDIVVREECHYKISDIGETIYLNKKEAQIKLDEINEQKYKDYPILE